MPNTPPPPAAPPPARRALAAHEKFVMSGAVIGILVIATSILALPAPG